MTKPTADQWREIDRIFAAALDQPPGDRAAFLDDTCRGDAELRSAVRELLDSSSRAESFLETPLVSLSGDLWEGASAELESAIVDDLAGTHIGRYRLIRQLAHGGMGTVYLAERADGEFERRVALKLLRRGLDTDDILARFRVERQILASLDHPHIARLIDGGGTEDGRPYLVMEYVQGRPITDYCDAHRLGVKDRLRLFATVMRAVAHAHRNLVVHRDLKPSNILVTEEGTPKLLDFGIAKLLGDTEDALRTRTGLRLMTPEYASPEQLRGDPVTTASDVYQLGVLLYRLLTGARPFPVEGSLAETGWTNRTGEPTRPSVAASRGAAPSAGPAPPGIDPDRLRKQLRGDLDNIVLMALRAEPERRYPSVAQLTEDIERHLSGLPVMARSDSVGYRLRKFAGRHRAGVGAAAIILLMLLGYAVTVTVQSRQIARERDRARIEAAKATEVKDFLVGLFEVASPDVAQGEAITAREILDRGADRIRRELSAQPTVRAELLSAIAQIYGQLALAERALPLAEEALSIRRGVFGPDDPELAASLLQVGKLSSAMGTDPDMAVLREAVRAARRAHGSDHPLYAEALFAYAHHAGWSGGLNHERGQVLLDSAITILRTHPGEKPQALLAEVLTASVYGNRDTAQALGRMREALDIRRSLYGENHPVVAQSLSDIALAIQYENPPESARLLRRAVGIYRDSWGEAHPVALTLANNLAGVLRDGGELAEAEALYREVLRVRREEGQDLARLAYQLYGLGRTLVLRGKGGEAEPYLREAVSAFPDGDTRRNLILVELGDALVLQRRFMEAEQLLLAAYRSARDNGETDGESLFRQNLAALYDEWGRPDEASRYRAQVTELSSTVP